MPGYCFDKDINPSVDSYFCEVPVEDWSLASFQLHKNKEDTSFPALNQLFTDNLKKIAATSGLPRYVYSVVGRLINDREDKGKQKQEGADHNSYIYCTIGAVGTVGTIDTINIINNQTVEVNQKKRKLDFTKDVSWMVENEDDFWNAWRQYLDLNKDRHEFCLEQYHVIECGYSIQCHPHIPQELIDHLGVEGKVDSPFALLPGFTGLILEQLSLVENDWKKVEKAVLGHEELKVQVEADIINFVELFFSLVVQLFRRPLLIKRISHCESQFNHLLVWPVFELAIDLCKNNSADFFTAEYILKASKDEYKADGCVVDEFGNEISLLETSGCYLLNGRSKYGFDYVKATFGALMLFNGILKKYFWATEDSALSLKIPFVHAMHNGLHLWALELCSSKLYASDKVLKCVVPTSNSEAGNMLSLGSFVWQLKRQLDYTMSVVQKLKQEHEEYEVGRFLGGDTNRVPLTTMVNNDLERPVAGSGFGVLLPEEKDGAEGVIAYSNE